MKSGKGRIGSIYEMPFATRTWVIISKMSSIKIGTDPPLVTPILVW